MRPEQIQPGNSLLARNIRALRAEKTYGHFCGARLQAGTAHASTCPPEGGRYKENRRIASRGTVILAAFLLASIVLPTGAAWALEATHSSLAGAVYDSQSFVKELGRLNNDLQAGRQSAESIRSLRESLPEAWSVDAGGRKYDVPTDLLVSQLTKADKQPELRTQQLNQARDYLDSLASEAASLSGQPAPSTDSARTKLDAILSRSEYARTQKETWWDKLRARIDELLNRALMRILRGVGGQASLGYALLWIVICATAIFIAYSIVRRWLRISRGQELALQAAAIPLRSWQEWVFASRQAAAHGDYRLAIHCAYWAGIARLQDLGALSADRAKTPREYVRALSKSKRISPETLEMRQQALSLLTSRLERTWYGYQIATEADFRDSFTQLETLGCHLP